MLVSDTMIIMCVINNLEHNCLTNKQVEVLVQDCSRTLHNMHVAHNTISILAVYVIMSCEKMLLLSGRRKFIVD